MEEYKLSDIAEVQTGPFGSQLHNEDYVTIGTPIVTVEHLGNRQFSKQNLPLVSDADKERLAKYILQEGDIVFSRVGSVDRCSYVSASENGWLFSGRCLRVRCGDSCYPLFLYYYFCNEPIKQYIKSIAVGATMPSINTKLMADIPIVLPNIENQKHIAAILSSIDDKIELNRRINGNLEQQAQALFKAWFVDFEPFDKNTNGIPYNWEKISLSDIMDYSGGSQPPASEFINTYKDGYIRFIQIRDYASNSHITYIPISPRNKLCQKEDIMIARYGASLGRICYGLEGAYNVALAKVIPKRPYYREFLRCYLSCNDFYEGINKKGNRAVQAGFNQSDINSFELWFPQDNNILERFDEICHNLFKARMYNDEENERLSKLRDTLLPRLMSGELNVNTITE